MKSKYVKNTYSPEREPVDRGRSDLHANRSSVLACFLLLAWHKYCSLCYRGYKAACVHEMVWNGCFVLTFGSPLISHTDISSNRRVQREV